MGPQRSGTLITYLIVTKIEVMQCTQAGEMGPRVLTTSAHSLLPRRSSCCNAVRLVRWSARVLMLLATPRNSREVTLCRQGHTATATSSCKNRYSRLMDLSSKMLGNAACTASWWYACGSMESCTGRGVAEVRRTEAVSYTHLTLPTILLV